MFRNDNIKSKTLSLALSAAKLSDLPKHWDGEDDGEFWTKAVVLVKKRDLSESYALAMRNAFGFIRYTRDFGSLSPVYARLAIYPYEFLDERQFCEYDTEQQMRSALMVEYGKPRAEEILALPSEDRLPYLREIGIKEQERKIAMGTFVSERQREDEAREQERETEAKQAAIKDADIVATTDTHDALPMTIVGGKGNSAKKPVKKGAKANVKKTSKK